MSMEVHNDRRIQFGITLPKSMLLKIDAERGLIPRSRYLELLIVRGMKTEKTAQENN